MMTFNYSLRQVREIERVKDKGKEGSRDEEESLESVEPERCVPS